MPPDLFETYGVKPSTKTEEKKTGEGDLFDKYKLAPVEGTAGVTKPADVSWGEWARTRVQKGVTGTLGALRTPADLADAAAQWVGEKVGAPQTGKDVGDFFRSQLPFGRAPTAEEMQGVIKRGTGWKDVNAPESWGTGGKILDAGAEAAAGGLVVPVPGGGLLSPLRQVIPSAIGGATSEALGETPGIKGTWLEKPARIIGGLLAGIGGAAAQNAVTSTASGLKNIALADIPDAQRQAARIIGRNLEADRTTMPDAIAQHQGYLPGTPFAATAGPNVRGAIRGAFTMKGPAREIIERGANQFVEGDTGRVGPVLDQISPLPPAEVRVPQLMDQARQDAPPIYRQAGVADLPQQILQTQPGAPTRVPSSILGPDGQPIMTTRPGAPVTSVTTNSPVLQSPALHDFIGQSGIVQQAISRTRGLSSFRDEPVTSMAMLDKVYKDLGSMEAKLTRDGDIGRARDIRQERLQLAQHIEAENPVYGRALQAFADPASLAEAATAGQTAAKQNIHPDLVRRQFDALDSDAHRREFLGGFAGVLRGKAGGSDRATTAERFWNSDYTRGKVQQFFGLEPNQFGPDLYEHINTALQNERTAARNLRDITKGSTTANKGVEMADNVGGDAGGVVSDVMHHGVRGAFVANLLEKIGALHARAKEGRTEAVNEQLARMGMQTDPAQVTRTQALVEAARRAAQRTAAGRAFAFTGGAVGGAAPAISQAAPQPPQPPGPADRIMQGLLSGGL